MEVSACTCTRTYSTPRKTMRIECWCTRRRILSCVSPLGHVLFTTEWRREGKEYLEVGVLHEFKVLHILLALQNSVFLKIFCFGPSCRSSQTSADCPIVPQYLEGGPTSQCLIPSLLMDWGLGQRVTKLLDKFSFTKRLPIFIQPWVFTVDHQQQTVTMTTVTTTP